jgi:hypothetical protein
LKDCCFEGPLFWADTFQRRCLTSQRFDKLLFRRELPFEEAAVSTSLPFRRAAVPTSQRFDKLPFRRATFQRAVVERTGVLKPAVSKPRCFERARNHQLCGNEKNPHPQPSARQVHPRARSLTPATPNVYANRPPGYPKVTPLTPFWKKSVPSKRHRLPTCGRNNPHPNPTHARFTPEQEA